MYSLVIPVYKNEGSLPNLLQVCHQLNDQLQQRLEVVFVVDGSPDGCYNYLQQHLPNCKFHSQLLLHSRNYGSFAAIRSGLVAAQGKYFAMMAADLQEPPELVLEFFQRLEKDECDVVVGTRDGRNDPLLSRLSSQTFWWFYRKFIFPEMPAGGVDMFGCNFAFRDHLLAMQESHSSLVGLVYWLGFRRKTVSYVRRERQHGKSAWTFKKKVNYLLDSIFSFSDLPIKLLLSFGALGMIASLLLGAVVLLLKIAGLIVVPGYAATILVLLFFGALNMASFGILGSYIWRAYANTQARPLAVIMSRKQYKNNEVGNEKVLHTREGTV